MGLPYGEETMIVGRTMWTQPSTSVWQTYRITVTKTAQRIASRRIIIDYIFCVIYDQCFRLLLFNYYFLLLKKQVTYLRNCWCHVKTVISFSLSTIFKVVTFLWLTVTDCAEMLFFGLRVGLKYRMGQKNEALYILPIRLDINTIFCTHQGLSRPVFTEYVCSLASMSAKNRIIIFCSLLNIRENVFLIFVKMYVIWPTLYVQLQYVTCIECVVRGVATGGYRDISPPKKNQPK